MQTQPSAEPIESKEPTPPAEEAPESTLSRLYREYLSQGFDHDQAVRAALVDSISEDETEAPVHYTKDQVRQAAIHTRQDIALVVHELAEIRKRADEIRRWVMVVAGLIALGVVLAI